MVSADRAILGSVTPRTSSSFSESGSRKVMESDDEVDMMFVENKQELIDFIAENKGDKGKRAIDLIMVAKYLERIADHATNIAEWVEFSITGIHKESRI